MPGFKQGPASRGSKKWLQVFVNEHQELLHRHLATSLKLPDGDTIRWLSPLKDDDFAEYRDQAFLDRLGIALDLAPLKEFWPRGGHQANGMASQGRAPVRSSWSRRSRIFQR